MAKAKQIDVDALLRSNNAKSSGKRSSVPKVVGREALSDKVAVAYEAYRDAEAAFRAIEGTLLEVANGIYEGRAKEGQFSKSLNFNGAETAGVQVSYQDKFSDLPIEAEGELRRALGDRFNACFEQKRSISMKITDDETVRMLVEKLGQEVFSKIFEIKISLATKDDMDRRQFELPSAARSLMKQYKASVKLRKE